MDEFLFPGITFRRLNEVLLNKHSAEIIDGGSGRFLDIEPNAIGINTGRFIHSSGSFNFPEVSVSQDASGISISCPCAFPKNKLCCHQSQVLYNIINRNELLIFFDAQLRTEKIKQFAAAYGMQNEEQPESFFQLEYQNRKALIKPRSVALLPLNRENLNSLRQQLLPRKEEQLPFANTVSDSAETIVVLKQHKYYKQLYIELYEASQTKEGKIKNPLTAIHPFGLIWKTGNNAEIKFYTGITHFQQNLSTVRSAAEMESLKAIISNPREFEFYSHNSDISENITANALSFIQAKNSIADISILITRKGSFYEFAGEITIDNTTLRLNDLTIKYGYFIVIDETFHLVNNFYYLKLIDFFQSNSQNILIHHSQYQDFKKEIIDILQDSIRVLYSDGKPASSQQLEESGFNEAPDKIIYLSGLGNFVLINPVMKYGKVEIPVLSKRQIYMEDEKGNIIIVQRNDDAEINFTALLLKQHPDFFEQLDDPQPHFYLHKERFLDKDWFLNAFEEWKRHDINILGFNELKGNRLNQNKAAVSIKVLSGINWFNANINVRFGKKTASLKQLHKSILHKNKFVVLDDGTLGILPVEWIVRFTNYFQAGEISGELLQIPKINFSAIPEWFAEDELENEVRQELSVYQSKLADFGSISEVEVPQELNATLRHYQQQGLNWLNFLDDFNFGGCLADDMGLGKTIQIIAFILLQRKKVKQNTNLLVVPTSLIYNWQEEVRKFAPSIKVHTIYGSGRPKNVHEFDQFEIILTSYGTLLADIGFLKGYEFNYIFLDESQNIKNPESQRYQSVRLLKSRNKIAITGTPVENNSFDLYGQLSFACPGLLGNKQYFRDTYSTPIDRFKDSKRAIELQKKIDPFILRRTKKEVATELPDKTEMWVYCEMGEQQRKTYDTYEKELREFISSQDEEYISKNPMYVLKGLTRLRQICNSPLLLKDEKLYGDESCKIDVLMEQIENIKGRHKILIFSQFVSMLNLIRKELEHRKIASEYLTGSTRNREAVITSFQENPGIPVFLISLKAGGTGLNLTSADYVFLVDPWWNPAVENQAIDRCYRIGQRKNVVAVRLICPDTIEEKIMKLQETKRELADDLIKTDGSILKSLSKTAILSLLH